MPTVKISDLTELATGPDAADLVVLVDSSVNETKKIQYSNFFGTPTIGTATITTANITTGGITTANIATGNITTELNFGDSIKAKFGAGDDLQVYHDGTNSYIVDTNAASDLIIKSDLIELQASDATTFATFIEGGAVTLNYANSTKIATTSTGVSVTGNVAATGNVTAVDVTATGDITGDVFLAGDGTASAPSITFANDPNTGFYSLGADKYGFTIGSNHFITYDVLQGIYHTTTSNTNGIPSSSENYIRVEGTTGFRGITVNGAVYSFITDEPIGPYYAGYYQVSGAEKGKIEVSSTGTTYSTSSDYRLKENIVNLTGAVDRLKELNPVRFNFIGVDKTVDGFLAHEAQAVVPESVTGVKDETEIDEDGNVKPVYQGIDQSKLVPLLVAAVQELTARIEALEG